MVRTQRPSANVNQAPPLLEPMDIPFDSSRDVEDFRVIRVTSRKVTLNPQPISIVPPSPPSKEDMEGTMSEFPVVSRPLDGSSSTRIGAPFVTPIEVSKRTRVIKIVESDEEEEEPVEVHIKGEMKENEEELDPLWVELERSAFVYEVGARGRRDRQRSY